MTQPDILWICVDQQRYDTISELGARSINTPNLDQLVRHGMAFEQAYCQSIVCAPSRASFLTGRYPGVTRINRTDTNYFPDSEVLITRLLADNGYRCGRIGKLHISHTDSVESPLVSGFEFVAECNNVWPDGQDYHRWLEDQNVDPASLYKDATNYRIPLEFHVSTWWREKAMEFIEASDYRPWLLYLSAIDLLQPFTPVASTYKAAVVDLDATRQGTSAESGPQDLSNTDFKQRYLASIDALDAQIGQLLDQLQQTGKLDNTLIVFMSDHGALFGESSMAINDAGIGVGNDNCFTSDMVRVPLIFSCPGKIGSGIRNENLVELVDIMPTLLDAAQINIPDYVQGVSLWPQLTGEDNQDYHRKHVLCEAVFSVIEHPDKHDEPHGSMYYDGRYKLIVFKDSESGYLFDLHEDVEENINLWDSEPHTPIKVQLLRKHVSALLQTDSGTQSRNRQ